ncbi:MAG: hypothetical protein M5U34_41025 [Chloroflexi bacterium]|nr:hypothetical protein [Chloroflexota bacterium]
MARAAAPFCPGRNAALVEGQAWDYAVHVEGWTSGIYVPGEPTPERIVEASQFFVLADPGQQKVTIRVPKRILGDDPENWRFAAAVLSQEGFPSGGVWRVRDVLPKSEGWRIGGAPAGTTNHTRIMDLVGGSGSAGSLALCVPAIHRQPGRPDGR